MLAVKGETQNRFRVGIGVDLPSPMRSAIDFIASGRDHEKHRDGTCSTPIAEHVETVESGWFLHIDAKNALIPWWKAEDEAIRLRVIETQGRRSTGRIRFFRALDAAQIVDAFGTTVSELEIEDGHAVVPLDPYGFQELRLHWK